MQNSCFFLGLYKALQALASSVGTTWLVSFAHFGLWVGKVVLMCHAR